MSVGGGDRGLDRRGLGWLRRTGDRRRVVDRIPCLERARRGYLAVGGIRDVGLGLADRFLKWEAGSSRRYIGPGVDGEAGRV